MNISMIFWPSKIGNIYILFFRIFISCFINLYRENKEGKNKCRKKMRKLGKNKRKDKADSTWNGNKSDYIVCKFCVSKGDKVWKLSKCVRNWYLHSWNSSSYNFFNAFSLIFCLLLFKLYLFSSSLTISDSISFVSIKFCKIACFGVD